MNWLMDHLEGVLALIAGTIAGVAGSVRMYFTMRTDIEEIKNELAGRGEIIALHSKEIEELKRNNAIAGEQRRNIIANTQRTDEKVDIIVAAIIKGET